MKTITNTFLKGLVFSLPVLITFGFIYWLFVTAEHMLRVPLQWLLPSGWYVTGMGVVSTLAIVFTIGVMVQAYLIGRIFSWFERLLGRIPFVKTLYGSAKDLLEFVAGGQGNSMQRVVRVSIDGGIHSIGFVTQEDVTLGDADDLIAVYVPMSYMIGGFLLYVPRERIQPLDIPVQQAMQQVLTAHIAGSSNTHGDSAQPSRDSTR